MDVLVQQGKVLYVGSSNFAGWHIAKAQEAAKARHFMGLVSEQSLYNLNDRMIELEVIPACKDYGLGLIPWSPLSGGLLGGALQKLKKGRRTSDDMKKDRRKTPTTQSMGKVLQGSGRTTRGCGARMAAGKSGCHCTHHRSAHHQPTHKCSACIKDKTQQGCHEAIG